MDNKIVTPWKNHGSYNIPAAHDNPGYEMDTNSYSASHNGNGNSERRKSSSVSAAVRIQHASKSYGSGPKVLNDLNMTIEKGTIYSLLGSSGCGKTTLLSCIVGIRNLNSGEIFVFGGKPGSRESGIPGKRVGYMPQDLALYNDFSINESMQYFAALYDMSGRDLRESRDFLIKFLDLPDADRRIGTLSGGQKRRVSLALSLIHSPELLILDEPTVGVDPLLRENIWNHLLSLVATKNTTVIITTHYTEEARPSNKIGLMRGGRLITESSPQELLDKHETNSLEDIVLKLCRNDDMNMNTPNFQDRGSSIRSSLKSVSNMFDYRKSSSIASIQDQPSSPYESTTSFQRIKALVAKNYVVMTRNIILLLFMMIVPATQVLVICLAIGNDPKPMWMGVVNHEMNHTACPPVSLMDRVTKEGCDVENLSCKFLAEIPSDTIYLRDYATDELARDAVKAGKVWGFFSFPEKFSDNVYERAAGANTIENETLQGSYVNVEMDYSNKQIASAIKKEVYDAFEIFLKDMLVNCGFYKELAESPIRYLDPVYGTDDTDFKEFIAPGVLLAMVFFFPLCSSGVSYIWDKKQGTLERSMVAGVQSWEVMASFFVTEGIVLVIQCIFSFSIIIYLFNIEILGSTSLAIGITFMMGLGGVSMGFLIASFCDEEIEAVMIAIASFFPNIILSGIIWPTEGMPIVMQYITYLLPCKLASESIRSIVSRGWEFTHIGVWPGFATTAAWIALYWLLTLLIHRYRFSKR
ncbi:ABC transporter G family member 20 isoform X2 [Folsomia candida]|uniref:ABC transporter G family member 20 n=1 Tax=Folsomia candida TaxID=158441 RepID=A0A226EQ64_FOLCA|nr:ABC transporter G family member 20 isoform X2 [Folsomia candida]OXA59297.1 ABC transporter G family member 20 [Folsomia candida]